MGSRTPSSRPHQSGTWGRGTAKPTSRPKARVRWEAGTIHERVTNQMAIGIALLIFGLASGIYIGFRLATWAIRESIKEGRLTEEDVRRVRGRIPLRPKPIEPIKLIHNSWPWDGS